MAFSLTGDFYVDAVSGDDGNAGTNIAPFKTIPAAISAAEAASTGYYDIVVGAGVYTERIVQGSTTHYMCLKADGLVIYDAATQSTSAFYNGNAYQIKGFTIINAPCLWRGSNDSYFPKFESCYLKDIVDWYLGTTLIEQGKYYFVGCIIENVRSINSSSAYARYFNFISCLLINSSSPGQTLGVYFL